MARAKFTAVLGLDELVASMCVDDVDRIARKVEATAKRKAPPTKRWITFGDGKVRHSHRAVDGDEIPANLRFSLQAFEWDVQHPQLGGVRETFEQNVTEGGGASQSKLAASFTYLLEPRDKSGEHYVQIFACRCALAIDPFGVARMVNRTKARQLGAKVRSTVYAQGEYVVGAEFGDEYPLPSGERKEPGTRFMRDTVIASAI